MSVQHSTTVTGGLAAGAHGAPIARPIGRSEGPEAQPGGLFETTDTVISLSDEAREFLGAAGKQADRTLARSVESADPDATGKATDTAGRERLSGAQQRQVEQLRARDTEVRAHEAAHAAGAGSLGGGQSLEYTTGPDGKRYAVAGEVSIDTSAGRTPEETIARARMIRSAALAPASPSAQDMAVASSATQMEADARAAIQERGQLENRARTEAAGSGENEKTGPKSGERPLGASAPTKETDFDRVLLQLEREQMSTRGGMNHAHLASDCGGCRRSAIAYA